MRSRFRLDNPINKIQINTEIEIEIRIKLTQPVVKELS